MTVADSGEKAMEIALSDQKPDLILLDIMIPDMDKYEVCWRLKNDYCTLQFLWLSLLTCKTALEDEKRGLEMGAVDFIVKPIISDIVMARVRNHLVIKFNADRMRVLKIFLKLKWPL